MDESSLKLTASEMMQHESITNTGTAMTDGSSTIRGVDWLASLELGMPFNTYIEHMHSDLAFHKIESPKHHITLHYLCNYLVEP